MKQVHEISPWSNIKSLKKNIRGDFLSGITVAIIALPLALAFGDLITFLIFFKIFFNPLISFSLSGKIDDMKNLFSIINPRSLAKI